MLIRKIKREQKTDPEITGDFATEEDFEAYCKGFGAGTLQEQLLTEYNGYILVIRDKVYEHFKDNWKSTTKEEILDYARENIVPLVTPDLPRFPGQPTTPTLPSPGDNGLQVRNLISAFMVNLTDHFFNYL